MSQQTPNPSTDNFDDLELKQEMERKEASYPKKEDGSVDIDALTPEEASIYWKDRHDASTRGFHQFKAKTEEEMNELRKSVPPAPAEQVVVEAAETAETLDEFEKNIPDFDLLDDSTQANLRAIFQAMDRRLQKNLDNDPGVKLARQTFAAQKWDESFNRIAPAFGTRLTEKREDFRARYFQANNVPDNIDEILTQLGKSYLYDQALEDGAAQERERNERIDPLRGTGGPKTPVSGMTIDDWERLRKTNPKAFAARSKEFDEQMASGQLDE